MSCTARTRTLLCRRLETTDYTTVALIISVMACLLVDGTMLAVVSELVDEAEGSQADANVPALPTSSLILLWSAELGQIGWSQSFSGQQPAQSKHTLFQSSTTQKTRHRHLQRPSPNQVIEVAMNRTTHLQARSEEFQPHPTTPYQTMQ